MLVCDDLESWETKDVFAADERNTCPQCGMLYTLEPGLSFHMTCNALFGCGFEYCWYCLEHFEVGSPLHPSFYHCTRWTLSTRCEEEVELIAGSKQFLEVTIGQARGFPEIDSEIYHAVQLSFDEMVKVLDILEKLEIHFCYHPDTRVDLDPIKAAIGNAYRDQDELIFNVVMGELVTEEALRHGMQRLRGAVDRLLQRWSELPPDDDDYHVIFIHSDT